jgi:hypothetical protein
VHDGVMRPLPCGSEHLGGCDVLSPLPIAVAG